jgi:nondiscriminating glutamyl-tRNA synthetase
MPTFHFANVIDDYDMEVTHVVRGEDHISNTFPQMQIYNALGWNIPSFAHISLILAQDKSKLSKRNGSKSIEQLKDENYSSEAVFNYISTLGWSHPEGKEILSKEEIVPYYSIDRVKKSNSCFDENKLKWINRKWKSML